MDKNQIIEKTKKYAKNELLKESSGHDWWHVYRVWKNSINIGRNETANMFIVEIASLLHDIDDWKISEENHNAGNENKAHDWMKKMQIEEKDISHVCEIIKNMSFKGSGTSSEMKTIEGMIVQDADRLDAMGAIGIARSFAFAGNKNLPIHNPSIKPQEKIKSFDEYKYINRSDYTQINHFYEKLLLLKDLMNTETAKKIAQKRHNFMKKYLNQFFLEWEGKD
ncbi:MAG: HD domain-containing protein [Candidatus Moranbacteria bacterium]|nr:HD domain-containing protein [Candidatus Moranbacteria bacterium]